MIPPQSIADVRPYLTDRLVIWQQDLTGYVTNVETLGSSGHGAMLGLKDSIQAEANLILRVPPLDDPLWRDYCSLVGKAWEQAALWNGPAWDHPAPSSEALRRASGATADAVREICALAEKPSLDPAAVAG